MKTEIISEVGQAHDGSLGTAHAYIDAVTDCLVDTVKFQIHIADAESSKYDSFRKNFSYQDKSRYDYWKRMEFSRSQWEELKSHTEDKGLRFLCTPFSPEAVDLMLSIGCDRFKIGSGDTSNRYILQKIKETGYPVLLSTGMSDYAEINEALDILSQNVDDITLFHCTTQYPTPPENIILDEIKVMNDKFDYPIGFSDHSGSIYPGIVASYLGIVSIEVHTVLSKLSFGPDVSSSLDINQLKHLVEGIRFIEKIKESKSNKESIVESLSGTKNLFNRSFFLSKELKKGVSIQKEHLKYLKPGIGLGYDHLDNILGKKPNIN